MGLKEEFDRYRLVYIVFFISGGMLLLVNQLEGAYARTLISCDTPVSTEPGVPFSGSATCGDRGQVINGGTMLSSTAQSCEMFAKVMAMLICAVFSDLYGRKFVLVMGMSATTVSVMLFVVGCLFPPLSRYCFYIGQGLQGAFPAELVGEQIAIDLAMREETDTQAVYGCAGMATQLSSLIFVLITFAVQALELSDFTYVWIVVFFINAAALTVAVKYFPETRKEAGDTKSNEPFAKQLQGELQDYQQLFSIAGLPSVMITYVFKSLADALFVLVHAIPMAYYGFSQSGAMLALAPLIFVTIVFMGVVPGMSQKHGERKAFWYSNYYLFSMNFMLLGMPITKYCFFGTYYLWAVVNPGYENLTTAMCTKFLGDRMAKYTALRKLSSYSLSIFSGPLYASAFDAKASSYSLMILPVLVSLAFRAMEFVFWFHPRIGSFRYMDGTLEILMKERIDNASAEQKEKDAEEKKAD